MLRPTENEIATYRQQIISECKLQVTNLLHFSKEMFFTMFPGAKILVTSQAGSTQLPTNDVLAYKSEEVLRLVSTIFKKAIKTCADEECDLPLQPSRLPHKIGELIIDSCLKIQSFGRDLTDLDYYFLNDLGKVLGLSSLDIYGRIEQTLYQVRKRHFRDLKPMLSKAQREISAWLMIKAIRADNRVHPAEIKYFEIIADLLDNDQTRLEQLESKADQLEQKLPMILIDDIAEFLFKYLVEIVMCDKDYDPVESQFIKEIAKAFEFDQTRQDMILQPIAAALMVKTDLFQQ